MENPRIIHSFPQLTKSIAAAKEFGSTAAVYASSSHTKHVRSLLMEERDRPDINSAAEVGERALQGFELADYILYLSEYSKDTFIENGFEEDNLIKVETTKNKYQSIYANSTTRRRVRRCQRGKHDGTERDAVPD